ncbi:MAG: asparagine synthase (glutamine-hydrolyzing) [Zetaproteobacteria bacterium CG12_big_fil_rev_8_21_14_0_65_55_1124]|nr:MAG: asparagine synthase (glutamine-hydrolyzing) [Zetaproteobacteria bacterium CG08_land_8_20_14_0_20_55_17]PIW43463.1 MAG: asparagine synthase (glutamine-hydrolyzing) [Zetaproteobacteria bacterium CG12_big_fil_rev_8_21_14_0_65_55_1124]PIY54094.1 MAG: asparagine synthase (glutamine-hydrolyzing) [Zetaproteobacteria bacterium CG_4_10_14_0_8_um_filter_55_43]PIZ39087.1 MAG: asparagine synthase (glutamine-hydrolyzing) [Zetaproteobacteria bacterium CG_4_10_14_0_2_um_filter_55_20]PJB81500.1 MAG: as
MCGFVGGASNKHNLMFSKTINNLEILSHRGPDDSGLYQSEWMCAGFRRLSIQDTSTDGHQPMTFDGLTILHNGEIYNFREVRNELCRKGYSFESKTDTEVFLKGFHAWGLHCLEKFNGMFATVIIDERNKRVMLIRDRLGIKPLYYVHKKGEFFAFASEIKALKGIVPFTENREKVVEHLIYRSVVGEKTLFNDVCSLLPGEYLVFDHPKEVVHRDIYYAPTQEMQRLDMDEAVEQAEKLLIEAIGRRLISDVEVGLQLSGGVDSGLIAAIVQTHFHKASLHSFSISMTDSPEMDESRYQMMVAGQYGITHHDIPFTGVDFQKYLDHAVWHNDYPIVHPNAVAIMKLAEYAKQYVTVILSGEGADEAFFGYPKYKFSVHRGLLGLLISLNPLSGALLPDIGKFGYVKSLIKGVPDFKTMFVETRKGKDLSYYMSPEQLRYGYQERLCMMNQYDAEHDIPVFDQATSLRELLRRFDRMTMSASIEGRVPFCDHQLMEFANSLPASVKANRNGLKLVLKRLAEKYLPHELIYREKMGFSLPIDKWFSENADLRTVASVLGEDCFLDKKIVDPDRFRAWWNGGTYNQREFIDVAWPLLGYELWHRKFISS